MHQNQITNSSNFETEDFYYDETVDIVDYNSGTVTEGKIISIRGRILIVQMQNDKTEQKFEQSDNCVLKQWHPNRPFTRFNRVDFSWPENNNYWVEGIVMEIDNTNNKIKIQYIDKNKELNEEWWVLPRDSSRLSTPGSRRGKVTNKKNYTLEEINAKLFSNKKFCKMNQKQENLLRSIISENNLVIKEVAGDGNCLFRAISIQVYGDEKYHWLLREKCMDYIRTEKDFFIKFIEGGDEGFEEYIAMKNHSGVWGDDIELEAWSEWYNRPIEIYANSKTPLKTFHENEKEINRLMEGNTEEIGGNASEIVMKYPIRISYHGGNHYNSIIPNKMNIKHWGLYSGALLKSEPGSYEDQMITRVRNKNNNQKSEINSIVQEDIEMIKGRSIFLEKKNCDLDQMWSEQFALEGNEDTKEHSDKPGDKGNAIEQGSINQIEEVIQKSELENNEEELIKSAIKESLENANTNPEHSGNNANSKDIDYYSIPSIQTALEFGFSWEDAVVAYSIYGDNPDLLLQYLYSLNENKF